MGNFYNKATTRDRLTSWCKACCRRNTERTAAAYRASEAGHATRRRSYEKRRALGLDIVAKAKYRASAKYREWLDDYQSRPATRAKLSAIQARERAKRGARAVVNNAIADGRLLPAHVHQCHYCGEPAAEYHHHLGYEPEHAMDVLPACVECHRLIDLRSRADALLAARIAQRVAESPHTAPSTAG